MKRTIAITASLSTLVALSACGGAQSSQPATTATVTTSSSPSTPKPSVTTSADPTTSASVKPAGLGTWWAVNTEGACNVTIDMTSTASKAAAGKLSAVETFIEGNKNAKSKPAGVIIYTIDNRGGTSECSLYDVGGIVLVDSTGKQYMTKTPGGDYSASRGLGGLSNCSWTLLDRFSNEESRARGLATPWRLRAYNCQVAGD